MRKHVQQRLRQCALCLTHNRHPQRHPIGQMYFGSYPMEFVAAVLIGPFTESHNGNKYILTIIDFCTGWAEAIPIPTKSNQAVWDAFSNGFICRHGVCRVLLTDHGAEFTALAFERYLSQIGIEHRMSTPAHPQSNGKIERFNRTLKQMIQKAVNNQPSRWEEVLNDVLLAYRASVSTTTGYTPHFLMTGRHLRMPMQKALRASNENEFGNRLDTLATALKIARSMTEDSRKHDGDRLAQKAKAHDISPGDSVMIKSEERLTLTARWNPRWTVTTRVRGPVIYVHNQQTGKSKVHNAEKVRIVDPNQNWDTCNPRPVRKQARSAQPRRTRSDTPRDAHPVDPNGSSNYHLGQSGHTTQCVTTPDTPHLDDPDSRDQPSRYRLGHNEDRSHPLRQSRVTTHTTPSKHGTRTLRSLSRRGQLAADQSDDELEADLEIKHLRKRKSEAPTEFLQKRARQECIALVMAFTQ